MITVEVHKTPTGNIVGDTYRLYREAFTPLLKVAVQNHMLSFTAFNAIWNLSAIEKHVVYVDGELAGISVVTNKLHAWDLISPQYFEDNYPEQYHTGRIWYVGFVCVDANYQKSGAFQEMLASMTAGRKTDLFFMDFCKTNLDKKIILLCTRALSQQDPTVIMDLEDVQEFWKVEWENV